MPRPSGFAKRFVDDIAGVDHNFEEEEGDEEEEIDSEWENWDLEEANGVC